MPLVSRGERFSVAANGISIKGAEPETGEGRAGIPELEVRRGGEEKTGGPGGPGKWDTGRRPKDGKSGDP